MEDLQQQVSELKAQYDQMWKLQQHMMMFLASFLRDYAPVQGGPSFPSLPGKNRPLSLDPLLSQSGSSSEVSTLPDSHTSLRNTPLTGLMPTSSGKNSLPEHQIILQNILQRSDPQVTNSAASSKRRKMETSPSNTGVASVSKNEANQDVRSSAILPRSFGGNHLPSSISSSSHFLPPTIPPAIIPSPPPLSVNAQPLPALAEVDQSISYVKAPTYPEISIPFVERSPEPSSLSPIISRDPISVSTSIPDTPAAVWLPSPSGSLKHEVGAVDDLVLEEDPLDLDLREFI